MKEAFSRLDRTVNYWQIHLLIFLENVIRTEVCKVDFNQNHELAASTTLSKSFIGSAMKITRIGRRSVSPSAYTQRGLSLFRVIT